MEEMRKLAFESVARGCGFGMLAIVCVMVGMSFDPRAVFQAGGILTLMMVFILILKARYALTQNYKHTEMWLYLRQRLPAAGSLCAMGGIDRAARRLFHLSRCTPR